MTIDDQVLPPILCQETSSDRTKYLQSLVAGRDKVSRSFRAAVELVDTMEVGYIPYMILLHLIEFQDKDAPSKYKNTRWGFSDWSWNTPHLSDELHEDVNLFDRFLAWYDKQVSGLPQQVHLHKSQVQELLLGLALAIRDIRLVCFTDHKKTPLPPSC